MKLRIVLIACLFACATFWLSRGAIASSFYERGLKAKTEWQLKTAINYFDWSLRFSNTFDAHFEKGECLQLRGDFLSSQKEFDVLLKTQIEDKEKLSRLHNAIGVNQFNFTESDAAIASHQKALDLARQTGKLKLEAQALIDLSRVLYHSKGKFDDALTNLNQAKSIALEISDEHLEAHALRNLGVVYWWFKGELDRPLREFYLPALELYRKHNDQRSAAIMLSNISHIMGNKGDIYRLMQYQNESMEIKERIGDEAGLSDSYMALGNQYVVMGNYRKARELYGKCISISERIGYRLTQNEVETYLASVYLNLNEFDEAIRLFNIIYEREKNNPVLAKYRLGAIAHTYKLKGDYPQSLSFYEQTLQMNEQIGSSDDRFASNILVDIAECYIGLGDWKHASEFMARAEAYLQRSEVHAYGDIQQAIVRALFARHEGKDEEALKYFQDVLETESQIFASAKTNFLTPPPPRLYEKLNDFLLDYSNSNTNENLTDTANKLIFRFLENMRYRSLRNFLIQVREKRTDTTATNQKERELTARINRLSQSLKQHNNVATREQLQQAYAEYEEVTLKAQLEQPQYLAIRSARPVELSELQQKLSAETALVEFLFVGEKVFALITTQKGLKSISLPVSKSTLAAKTILFRSLIFNQEETVSDWFPVAESLHKSLIEPIEKTGALIGIKRIGYIPYGFLHDLPFSALVRRENETVKFLVEDYTLFQTPSATFYANKREEKIFNPQESVTIAFGHESGDTDLLPLEFAAQEAQTVAQTTHGAAFINKNATETEIKKLAYHCDYLHLATHAIAEREMPLFSRLLLEPTNTDDGNLTVREIFELGLRTKLVTLSACETGQSFSASGNEFIEQDRVGLIEAFLHAGSKSVLASLFPVSDKPTSEFMKFFYQNLREKDKADALAETQRTMISNLQFKHPRYWSPFFIVGSDR